MGIAGGGPASSIAMTCDGGVHVYEKSEPHAAVAAAIATSPNIDERMAC
jgi:hypothetical protein